MTDEEYYLNREVEIEAHIDECDRLFIEGDDTGAVLVALDKARSHMKHLLMAKTREVFIANHTHHCSSCRKCCNVCQKFNRNLRGAEIYELVHGQGA